MQFLALLSLVAVARSQGVGTNQAETHPKLTYSTCDGSGCTQVDGEVVIDANWRWLHTGKISG